MAESWMIDELAHAGPEHLDPAFVAGYDRKQGDPDPAEDLTPLSPTAWTRLRCRGPGRGRRAIRARRRPGSGT